MTFKEDIQDKNIGFIGYTKPPTVKDVETIYNRLVANGSKFPNCTLLVHICFNIS